MTKVPDIVNSEITVADMRSPDVQAALEAIPDGVVITDRDGRIVFANRAYSRILCRRELVMGRRVEDIEPTSPLLKVLTTLRAVKSERLLAHSLSKEVIGSIYPLFDGAEPVGAITVFQDRHAAQNMVDALAWPEWLRSYLVPDVQADEGMPEEFAAMADGSPKLLEVLSLAARVAATGSTVLLLGENGTGKDVLAQAIVRASPRRDGPFIRINCAAMPEDLLDSVMMGHEPGAFTGAGRHAKPGKFEAAHGGTLFLDEIGDMSLRMQAKVLRALETGEVRRLGGKAAIKVDIRFIAASNRALEEMVEAGTFRKDLYYRLNVFSLQLPALRERLDQVPGLARRFLAEFAEGKSGPKRLAPDALRVLTSFQWPGNVRELRNVMQYAVALSPDQAIGAEHLPGYLTENGSASEPEADDDSRRGALGALLGKLERRAFEVALDRSGNNCTRAMTLLGMSRQTFYRRLKTFGLADKVKE